MMLAINKRQQFETVGELIAILSKVSPDTPVAICGDNDCFYHEEQDGSGICLDCEDLSECYDEEERPLTLFLREEVPFRLQEVLDLPDTLVTEDLIQACVAELSENSELMFNQDKIDELLRGVLRRRGIDADTLETDERKDGEQMIPKMTQDGPNIVPQHWCSNCGRKLVPHGNYYKIPADNFCPGCGKEIEWEKEVPVKWEPMDCDTCGKPMIIEVQGHMVSNGNYVGTTTCRTCMAEYCAQTNCLGCKRGTYPDCKYKHLKRPVITEEAE